MPYPISIDCKIATLLAVMIAFFSTVPGSMASIQPESVAPIDFVVLQDIDPTTQQGHPLLYGAQFYRPPSRQL
ncbi:hypothetical protein [Mycobacterium uberis]|uniref:hypothetical protein n=1 Tax=Mycobacterium uberis TaxID=2162698 RepID=UPI000E3090AD|nr:hypothetical protein [Mycobacterium uberis]